MTKSKFILIDPSQNPRGKIKKDSKEKTVAVKISDKLVIWVTPSTDIKEIKKKYAHYKEFNL